MTKPAKVFQPFQPRSNLFSRGWNASEQAGTGVSVFCSNRSNLFPRVYARARTHVHISPTRWNTGTKAYNTNKNKNLTRSNPTPKGWNEVGTVGTSIENTESIEVIY